MIERTRVDWILITAAVFLVFVIPAYLWTSVWLNTPGPYVKHRVDLSAPGPTKLATGWLRKPGRHPIILGSILQIDKVEHDIGTLFDGVLHVRLIDPWGRTRLDRRFRKPGDRPNALSWSEFQELQEEYRRRKPTGAGRAVETYELVHRKPDYNNAQSLLATLSVDWSELGPWTLAVRVVEGDERFNDTLGEVLLYDPSTPPAPMLAPYLKAAASILSLITGLIVAAVLWWRRRG